MIRHARLLRADPAYRLDAALLARHPFTPCAATDRASGGFVAPTDDGELVRQIGDFQLACYQTEQRLLPASVVREAAAERAAELEREQGYRPGRKQMRDIAEQIETQLLPRAFVQKKRTWLALGKGLLLIDSSSGARADEVIEGLKRALGELPFALNSTRLAPGAGMTRWLADGDAPAPFTLDRAGRIEQATEERGRVSFKHVNLDDDKVRDYLAAGYVATQVALTWRERLSFVLNDDGALTQIAMLDIIKEQAERDGEAAGDGALGFFDAGWLIALSETAAAIESLTGALGGLPERDDLLGKAARRPTSADFRRESNVHLPLPRDQTITDWRDSQYRRHCSPGASRFNDG